MGCHAGFGHAAGDEGALPVPHFEQAFAAEPLVHAEDGVLVYGQFAGQLADRGQSFAGLNAAGGAERGDLVGDLTGDGDGGAVFDSEENVEKPLKIGGNAK